MIAPIEAFQPGMVRPPPRRDLLEAGRLAAVAACRPSRVLGDALDTVAASAATALHAAAAGVTLVAADGVEFAGMVGLPDRITLRAGSFCDEVVSSEAPLVVADAVDVAQFRSHSLVQEAGMRAYAGVPLVDHDGYPLGAVCVLDPRVGRFADAPLTDLAALACLAERLFKIQHGDAERAASSPQAPPRAQGWLGVKTARAHPSGSRPGVIVLRVAKESPAERAGLRPADVLHQIDGRVLRRPADIVAALAGRVPGDVAVIRLQRRRDWLSLSATMQPESSA